MVKGGAEYNVRSKGPRSQAMSIALAKWSLDDYHRMIDSGLLDRRRVEFAGWRDS